MPRKLLPIQSDLRKQVLRIVRKQKACDLDELILKCTSYSWTDVFLEVDELSRSGELCLLSKKAGEYTGNSSSGCVIRLSLLSKSAPSLIPT
jgi:hypothetical protein